MFVQFILVLSFTFNQLCYGQESPRVNPFTAAIKPVIGGKTSFTCQSLFGSSPLQVTWFKDGKEIHDSPSIRIKSNDDPSVLIIDSITSNHSGNFTCRISNRFGHDTYTVELVIEGPPNWIEKPRDVKSSYGETIIVNCIVSGYPKPRIQWKRLSGSSWINIQSDDKSINNIKQSNDKLILTNVTFSNNGRYGCSVINPIFGLSLMFS